MSLDGIGETQVSSIDIFFQTIVNLKIIKDLIDELEIEDYGFLWKWNIFKQKINVHWWF